ncbi:MAG: FAD-binding protein [Spirochaetia bacterium]|nr:FAD-binding protein [Spirochaetia bacterium]
MKAINCDVLVIGSGLSSLTCGSLLAKRGCSVILVESNPSPGGSCGSFRAKGRTLDIGTSMFFGFGKKGFNPHYFVMNELEEEIDVIKHPYMYRLYYENTPILFHQNIEDYFHQLEVLFPHDMIGIRKFYSYIEDLYRNVIAKDTTYMAPTEMRKGEMFLSGLKDPVKNIKIIPLLYKSAGDLLRKFVSSVEVIRFFSKLTSTYCYTTLDETPAILAITMFMENHEGGAYYTPGGSFQLPGKLEKAFEKYGGTIHYNTKATSLLFEKQKVVGATVKKGDESFVINAQYVVYGGTLLQLHTSLIPPTHQKPSRIKYIKNLNMTYPSVVCYAVVDKEALPDGLLPVQMYAPRGEALTEDEITLYIPSLADPSLCNSDEHVVMLIGPTYRLWPNKKESLNYKLEKDFLKERFVSLLDSLFPLFSTHIRSIKVATPLTIERFTLKERGYVAGPKQAMGQELLKRQKAQGDWKNLYHCGEATVMGTGSLAVTISGISAANIILRKNKMKEYRLRNYSIDMVRVVGSKVEEVRIGEGERILPTLNAIDNKKAIILHDKASKCQWCLTSPCRHACPSSYDIPSIMRKLECGNITGAKKTLKGESISSLSCINCPAYCQEVCSAKGIYSTSVAIKEILMSVDEI